MALTLTESVRTGWTDIRTPKHLRGALLHGARRLRELGYADMAQTWEARVDAMPRGRMNKNAINLVLMLACDEIAGIED